MPLTATGRLRPFLEALYDFWDEDVWGAQFITQRKVGIADRRLAYIHRALQAIVLVYVVVIEICLWHRYAAFEAPAANVDAWPESSYSPPRGRPAYCSNPAYDWGLNLSAHDYTIVGSAYTFGPNSSCFPFIPERHIQVSSSSAMFTTFVRCA